MKKILLIVIALGVLVPSMSMGAFAGKKDMYRIERRVYKVCNTSFGKKKPSTVPIMKCKRVVVRVKVLKAKYANVKKNNKAVVVKIHN